MIARRALLLATLATPALAQEGWPTKPVRLVVPFPPGGSTDIAARLIAERLGQRLGQAFVIENRGGAGGILGMDAVAKGAADGYAFVVGTVSSAAINYPLFGARMPFTPEDFSAVGLMVSAPNLIVVNAASPFRTLRELVAHAKAHPGALNFGTTGPGSSVSMAGALLTSVAGIDVTAIPFRGGAQVQQELIAGRVDFEVEAVTSAIALIREGRLRPLAVVQRERSAALPDVPTTAEEGLAEVDAPSWYGMLAPARTPRPIVEKLGAELDAVLREPALAARLADLGGGPLPLPGGRTTPAAFDAFIRAEIVKWAEVVRRTGVKPE